MLWSDNIQLQWCMDVTNNITCCHQLYKLVPVLFNNFIQLVPILFTPVQLCTFLNFWEFVLIMSNKTGLQGWCQDSFQRWQTSRVGSGEGVSAARLVLVSVLCLRKHFCACAAALHLRSSFCACAFTCLPLRLRIFAFAPAFAVTLSATVPKVDLVSRSPTDFATRKPRNPSGPVRLSLQVIPRQYQDQVSCYYVALPQNSAHTVSGTTEQMQAYTGKMKVLFYCSYFRIFGSIAKPAQF